ncbi:MAG: hypothetical protein AB7Y46_07865, partial [Armatimonadota bacterium]
MLLVCLAFVAIAFRGVIGGLLTRDRAEETPQVLFPLQIETAQASYQRFDLVPLTVRMVDPQGRPVSDSPPEVVVLHEGEAVETVGHYGKRVRLTWSEDKQAWTGWWPPPWNPDPGLYRIEARAEIDPAAWPWDEARTDQEEGEIRPKGEAWAIAQTPFELTARQQPALEPGMCVATWEFDFKEHFTGPTGRRGDWRTLFDWVEYMGADTFWFRGAVTDPPDEGLTLEQPFKPINLQAIPRLGAEAHRRGLKFGTWAVAYSTYPRHNTEKKPKYQYALDISRSTGAVSYHNFISLLDERRVEHLADFFRQMQASEHVDMIGLDYMRSDRGGYEMVPRFTTEMPIELPEGWASMSERQRQAYVARKIEEEWREDADPDFYD